MPYQSINRGTVPNDNTGDTLRDGASKINDNFTEIYQSLGDGSNITFNVASYTSETQTLTNKTINSANNTLVVGFNDLYDINIPTTPNNEQVLKYNTGASGWIATDQDVKGVVKSNLIPNVDGAYSLGSNTAAFQSLYLTNATIASNNGILEFDSPIKIGNGTANVPVEADLVPTTDSLYNLGSPTNKFHSIYLANSTIYLGNSSLSVGPDGLKFVEEPPVRLNIFEKNVLTFNPNTDIKYAYENVSPLPADQENIYSIVGLSDANSANQFFDVGSFISSGWGIDQGPGFGFEFDTPIYDAKLNLYSFDNYKVPLLSYNYLKPLNDQGQPNYTLDANGFHTLAPFSPVTEGFVLGSNGEAYIVSPWTPNEFEIFFNDITFNTPGIFVQLEVYRVDPNKSVVKSIKPAENPVGLSADGEPSSNTANGSVGDLVVANGYLYMCHTANTWVRLPVETSW